MQLEQGAQYWQDNNAVVKQYEHPELHGGSIMRHDKGGSTLESFRDLPQLLINTLPEHSAANWYALETGAAVDLYEGADKSHLLQILKEFFPYSNFPVVPIVADDHRTTGVEFTRSKGDYQVYSLYTGERADHFMLEDIFVQETYLNQAIVDGNIKLVYDEKSFRESTVSILNSLRSRGYSFDIEEFPSVTTPEDVLTFLRATEGLKQQLSNFPELATRANKQLLIHLEILSKMVAIILMEESLGFDHGHPHPANYTLCWSKTALSPSALRAEIISPTGLLSIDAEAFIEAYPDVHSYLHQIDHDQLSTTSSTLARTETSQSKLKDMIVKGHYLEKVTGLDQLPVSKWDEEVVQTLLTLPANKVDRQLANKFEREFGFARQLDPQGAQTFHRTIEIIHYLDTTSKDDAKHTSALSSILMQQLTDPNSPALWSGWVKYLQNESFTRESRQEMIVKAFNRFPSLQTHQQRQLFLMQRTGLEPRAVRQTYESILDAGN